MIYAVVALLVVAVLLLWGVFVQVTAMRHDTTNLLTSIRIGLQTLNEAAAAIRSRDPLNVQHGQILEQLEGIRSGIEGLSRLEKP